MPRLTKARSREIIEDFKLDIIRDRTQEDPEQKYRIDFREDMQRNYQRTVWRVPLDLLRYRKDNSRINAEISEYEHLHEVLDEKNSDHQAIIGEMLLKSDIDKMGALVNDMTINGQREPAIATCDGFLINGNRRRHALEVLSGLATSQHLDYSRMRVVILPSGDEADGYGDGRQPEQVEIQRIEYAYQNQEDGRSEYSGVNKALQYRMNENIGWKLEQQLKRDPQYVNLSERRFRSEVKRIRQEFLEPLERVDEYLEFFDREAIYPSVSNTPEDPRGRWYSFKDLNARIYKALMDSAIRKQMGIKEEEISIVMSVVFKILRQRDLHGVSRLDDFIRSVPKILKNEEARKEFLEIDKLVPIRLPKDERMDPEGKPFSVYQLDKIWSGKHGDVITNQVTKCRRIVDYEDISEKPIELLEAALKKLNHRDMKTENIQYEDTGTCMDLCDKIISRGADLNQELDNHRFTLQKNDIGQKATD